MTSRDVGRESPMWRAACTGVSVYEVAALWTDLPTITRGVHKHPLLGVPILIGLTVHFYRPRRTP